MTAPSPSMTRVSPRPLRRLALLGLLSALLLAGACRKPPAESKGQPAPTTAPAPPAALRGVPLAPLLAAVPDDVIWAVVVGHLGRLATPGRNAFRLLLEHPRFRDAARELQRRTVKRWGFWLLDPAARREAGLPNDTALVVARRPGPDGVPHTLILIRGVKPVELLQGLTRVMRRRGARAVPAVRTLRTDRRTLLRFDDRWTCGFRRGLTLCADVPPGRWSAAVAVGARSVRSGPLASLLPRELTATAGIYLGPGPLRALRPAGPGLAALALQPPRHIWLGVSLRRHIRLRGVLLPANRSGSPRPVASPRGPSGLAAASDAGLVMRFQLPPRVLAAWLRARVAQAPVLEALLPPAPRAGPRDSPFWSGDVVLFSTREGLAARLGIARPIQAARALARLDLLLSSRLPTWQRRIRENGAGWDLTYTRERLAAAHVRRLEIALPRRPTSPYPTVRGARLSLRWSLTGGHLLVATDPKLFRHLRAHADKPDSAFLSRLPDAGGRAAFTGPSRLALLLRPDDPFSALPAPQRLALQQLLATLSPAMRRHIDLIRAASDLIRDLSIALRPRRVGTRVDATIALVRTPGTGLRLPAAYRAALVKKWGGNYAGFLRDLRALSGSGSPADLRQKAQRGVPPPGAASHSGWIGLLASVYAPWRIRSQRRLVHASGQAGLAHLGARLSAFAEAALSDATRPETQRRRWVRRLRSTPLTPTRRCCAAPDRRCRSKATDWRHPTWTQLGFHLFGPHRYRYQLRVRANTTVTRLELRAVGDPDCDGRSTQLVLPARVPHDTGRLELGTLRRIHREP